MTLRKRLDRLHIIVQPTARATMSEQDRRWYLGLCEPTIQATIVRFAGYLAERRYHHEVGNRSPHCLDWLMTTTEAERESRVRAELERYLAMDLDHPGTLASWIETADRDGWPPLGGLTFAMSRQGFEGVLAGSRAALDRSRGCDMPGSVAWRRGHPAWRPGMSTADATAFELELAAEVHRLEAAWLGSGLL